MPTPAPRVPAPEPLRLVQAFLNTNDLEDEHDLFASPGALRDWLAEHDLLGVRTELDDGDVADAVELREALRALTAANNALPADTESAREVVNGWGRRARLEPSLTADGASALLPRSEGATAALGRIVAVVHAAIADQTWPRLKACERDSCRWAFYDSSKNQSGRWCHAAVCGNRERSRRAYWRRRRAAGSVG